MEKEANKWIALNRGEYLITIDDLVHKVCITDGKNATVDGLPYSFNFQRINEDEYIFNILESNYTISLSDFHSNTPQTALAKLSSKLSMRINGRFLQAIVDDQRSLVAQSWLNRKSHSSKSSTLCAPMPGIITKIMVQQGDIIQRNGVILVLEAMKMENEIRALQQCKIEAVLVHTGTTVERNNELIKIIEI